MNTGMTLHVKSTSSEATEQLGERIGRLLRGSETLELVSDLGGGKTTLARGIARGAGSEDRVASPTFTISKLYHTQLFDIHHFDFYRLQEAGIMADELAEVTSDPQAVTLVEWANVVHDVLPEDRLTVTITQTPAGDRDITVHAAPKFAYILEGLHV